MWKGCHHVLLLQRRVRVERELLHPVCLDGIDLPVHHSLQHRLKAIQLVSERVGVVTAKPLVVQKWRKR